MSNCLAIVMESSTRFVQCKNFPDLLKKCEFFFIFLFFSRLGQGWEDPVHRETLHESVDHVPKEEKLKEAEKPVENSPEEKSSTETEEKNENVPVPTSSPSNEELAKMWQPKTRQSIAQRLKRKIFLVKLQQHTLKSFFDPIILTNIFH